MELLSLIIEGSIFICEKSHAFIEEVNLKQSCYNGGRTRCCYGISYWKLSKVNIPRLMFID